MAAVNNIGSLLEQNQFDSENWCHTRMNLIKIRHTWKISNLSFFCKKNKESITSPIFWAENNNKLKWRLKLYPKGSDSDSKEYTSLFLHLVSSVQPSVMTKFRMSILNCKKEETNAYNVDLHEYTVDTDWGYAKFIKNCLLTEKASDLLPDNTLTVFCEITAGR